jgi:hypothetical protein
LALFASGERPPPARVPVRVRIVVFADLVAAEGEWHEVLFDTDPRCG